MSNILNFRLISKNKLYRRAVLGMMALSMSVGIGAATAQPSEAGWLDLIFSGVRVYQLSNMSDSQEVSLGKDINARLVKSGQIKLYKNSALNAYVNEIGQALAAKSDRPNIPYTFQIVEDSSVNAFATMGGYVYVTTGLIKAADTEAELAGVIGHEIGHIGERHSVQQMRQAAIAQGVTGAIDVGQNRERLINIGTQLAWQLPNSRQAEYEADADGFETMGRAGYDQEAMVNFMQKLVRQGSPPEFLSTHPDARNRVNSLQERLETEATPDATDGMNASAYSSNVAPLR